MRGRVLSWAAAVFAWAVIQSAMTAYAQGYCSVSSGVSVSPSPVTIGSNFNISFALKEVRGASKTFEQVAIAILRADNSHVFDFVMYSNVTVPAYGSWSKTATNYLYGTQPSGTYKAIIRGRLAGGSWFDFDTTGSGVNPRSFTAIKPDTTKPVVSSFTVSPGIVTLGSSFTAAYTVSDAGGAGMKQVELWRAPDAGGTPGTWSMVITRSVTGSGPTTGTFANAPPAPGSWWYGAHVVDNAGNWNVEPAPRKVVVAAPDTVKPVITSFIASPCAQTLGGSFVLSGSAADAGGTGLMMLEIWRAKDADGRPGTWYLVSSKSMSGSGPVSFSLTDAPPTAGLWWYGAHAVDGAGNWGVEPSPRRVIVNELATAGFRWPVATGNASVGHAGACADGGNTPDYCYWLSDSEQSDSIWRDALRFQRYTYGSRYHLGADFNLGAGAADKDKPVYPVAKGVIVKVRENVCGWGNLVFVRHDTPIGTYISMYAHVNWLNGKRPIEGWPAEPGVPIAAVGNGAWYRPECKTPSGKYPYHLHFELRSGTDASNGPGYTSSKVSQGPQGQIDPDLFIRTHLAR